MEKQNNNKTVIALLLVIIFILATLCILFATGTISFKNNTSNNNQNNNNNENINGNNTIPIKTVNADGCKNSEITFNGITIKLEQENNDSMCTTKSFTINSKEAKEEFKGTWIDSYTIYDNNIIVLSGDTSGTQFAIYSLSNNSIIMNLTPETLEGYWAKSYTINNNKIVIDGKECGLQCSNEESGYPKATFEIEYSNNSFSTPKLVEKLAA